MIELMKALENSDIKFSLSVKNLKSGWDFKYNATLQVPSASVIKLPIMAAAFEYAKKHALALSDRIVVSPSEQVPFSIITMLDPSNSYTVKDLITLMIVQSDNTATNVLIDLLGMDNINKYMSSIGLKATILGRKMMDLEARSRGQENFTTAEDMNYFLELLYNNKIVDKRSCNLMLHIMKMQLDRTMLYYDIPDEVVTAHKTGELHNINHDVGIFYTEIGDYIFSMLTWDAINNNFARKTVAKAAKLVYDYFNMGDLK